MNHITLRMSLDCVPLVWLCCREEIKSSVVAFMGCYFLGAMKLKRWKGAGKATGHVRHEP